MMIDIDNKITFDLINNCIVGGRTRHSETLKLFLRKMKEQEFSQVVWISGDENEINLFTKNLPGSFFEKHNVNFNSEE